MLKTILKKYIMAFLLIFTLVFSISGCNNSNDTSVTSSKDIWKKNPVDVVAKYIENIGNNNRFSYIYSDIDQNTKQKQSFISKPNKKDLIEGEIRLKKAIKSVKLISVLPSKSQEISKNPIEIKNKKGESVKLYDPISLEAHFEIKYNDGEMLAFNEGENQLTFILVKDSNNDYKILSAGH